MRRMNGGCLAEIMMPVIIFTIMGIAMFVLTDTPFPSPAGLLPAEASQPAGGQHAGGELPDLFTSGVQRWSGKIVEWEQTYNVDRIIFATIMQIESCGDETATGSSGESSLFQVMPIHFMAGDNPYDPDTNARAAIGYFLRMHRATGYDVYTSFAAYNGGPSIVGTSYYQWPYATQKYYNLAKSVYDGAKAGTNVSQIVADRCPP